MLSQGWNLWTGKVPNHKDPRWTTLRKPTDVRPWRHPKNKTFKVPKGQKRLPTDFDGLNFKVGVALSPSPTKSDRSLPDDPKIESERDQAQLDACRLNQFQVIKGVNWLKVAILGILSKWFQLDGRKAE